MPRLTWPGTTSVMGAGDGEGDVEAPDLEYAEFAV
jgi:hypothetical protein